LRVLYDTNVLVKILSRRESILKFKDDIKSGLIHVTSGHVLSEVETVLTEKLGLTKQRAKVATRLLARQSLVVNPKNVEPVSRDPFDDYILAAAVTGKAKYLVTADKDLLVLKEHKNINIVTPTELRKILKK
jgi:uncharacterized protein